MKNLDNVRRFRRRRYVDDRAKTDAKLIVAMYEARIDLVKNLKVDIWDAVKGILPEVFYRRYLDLNQQTMMAYHLKGMVEDQVKGVYSDKLTDTDVLRRRIEDFLTGDHIPEHSAPICDHVKYDDIIDPRIALPGMRCAKQTSHDTQSGPIYCGDPAYIYASSAKYPAVHYIWCERHAKRHGIVPPPVAKGTS